MTDSLRVAVYGAQHPHVFPRLDLATQHENVEVIGVWDPREDIRDHLAERYGVPTFRSAKTLLGTHPDLTLIEGLDHQNPAAATMLAAGGSDLLIEKPGANTLDTMREMASAIAKTRVHAQIGYMLRFSPAIPRIQELLASGAIGDITLARFHASSPVGCSAEIWQSLPDDTGGVTFTDGCHMMDVIHLLFGGPRAVQGLVKRVPTGPTARSEYFKKDIFAGLGGEEEFGLGTLVHEDCSGAILDYDDKVVVFDATGWEARGWVEGWRIELYGTNGTVYAGLSPAWVHMNIATERAGHAAGWHRFDAEDQTDNPAEISLVADITYRSEFDELIRRLLRGERSQERLSEGVHVVETLDAIYRSSAADGRQVEL